MIYEKKIVDKLNFIKTLNFCSVKDTVKKVKRQDTAWKKIFAKDRDNKGLFSKLHKELTIYWVWLSGWSVGSQTEWSWVWFWTIPGPYWGACGRHRVAVLHINFTLREMQTYAHIKTWCKCSQIFTVILFIIDKNEN